MLIPRSKLVPRKGSTFYLLHYYFIDYYRSFHDIKLLTMNNVKDNYVYT